MTNPNQPCTKPGCPLHGQPHPGCAAHRKRTTPPQPCGRPPRAGVTTCPAHGGHAPAAQAAGAARRQEAAARRELTTLGVPTDGDAPDVDPSRALLDLIGWKHAEILWLRAQVQTLETTELVWSKTREKTGGEDFGTTSTAEAHVWWRLLRGAEDQLAAYAAAAHRAGIADRQLQLAEDQGRFAAAVLRRALDGMLAALTGAGMAEALQRAWPALVGQVVPDAIRALAAAPDGEGRAS